MEGRLEATAARELGSVGHGAQVDLAVARPLVAQDGVRVVARERAERPFEPVEALRAEADLHERAGESETSSAQALLEHLALAEVADRPELGPLVAGLGDRVEDALGVRDVRDDPDGQLES